MGSGESRQFVGAHRSLGEVISKTQFGGNVSDVGYLMRHGHLNQLGVRWCCLSFVMLVLGHITALRLRSHSSWRN
jgi:hypothetical protein